MGFQFAKWCVDRTFCKLGHFPDPQGGGAPESPDELWSFYHPDHIKTGGQLDRLWGLIVYNEALQ